MKWFILLSALAALVGLNLLPRKASATAASNGENIVTTGPATRGVRNNNWLNLEYRATIDWKGQTGTDGRYVIFSAPVWGLRAAMRNLRTMMERDNLSTIRHIVSRWAPMAENPTENYIQFVAARVNASPDQALSWSTAAQKLAMAMAEFENGYQPGTDDLYLAAFNLVDS